MTYRHDRRFFDLVPDFPNLKTLFIHHTTIASCRLYTLPGWTWFRSPVACFQTPSHRRLRCWPKTAKDLDTTKLPALLARFHFLVGKLAEQRDWEVLPMVSFETVKERSGRPRRGVMLQDFNQVSLSSNESDSSQSSLPGSSGSPSRDRERQNSSLSDDSVPWWLWMKAWARDVDEAERTAWAQGTEWMDWDEWEYRAQKAVAEVMRRRREAEALIAQRMAEQQARQAARRAAQRAGRAS